MRGARTHRGVWIGVALSALLHSGVGIVAYSVPMDRGDGMRAGSHSSGGLALVLPDPRALPPADDEYLRRLEEMLAREAPSAPPEPQPPVPPTPPRLVLGIDESTHFSDNWLGAANPTPHSAKLSDVTQPQLDTDPGNPGERAGASAMGPVGPVAPELMPPPSDAATPERKLRSPETAARDGADEGEPEAVPGVRSEYRGAADKTTRVRPGDKSNDAPDPSQPGPRANTPARLDTEPGEDERSENGRASRPAKAVKPKPGIEGDSSENVAGTPGKPGEKSPNPAALPSTAGGNASSSPGDGGEHAGEKSEKEADASSTEKSVEIRPGQPAAAQGLDITTKRPNFTRLTRVTAYPANPLLKVTFNARGIVTKVVLVESSGIRDVDDPVINAIYQWTAKGKALAELTAANPEAGVTISVRILLR